MVAKWGNLSDVKKAEKIRKVTSAQRAHMTMAARKMAKIDPALSLGEWRPIPGWERYYEVSDRGQIRRRESGLIRRLSKSYYGYMVVTLTLPSCKPMQLRVHRAVAMAFLPNPNDLPEVNHLDCDKTNNRVENLAWTTKLENMNHIKITAIEAFARCAAILREHALDYPDNPRVQEALSKCETKIMALSSPIRKSIGNHVDEKLPHWKRRKIVY